MKVHTVQGGGGLRLHVREWGKADGPAILFIHGWSQNHLCWVKQYESTLADEFRLVAYDLRGHGMSEAPLEPEHYTDGKLWADDVAAIIDQLGLVRPVLVGWSYGPFVICDYVRAHGQDRISAINFVEGAVKLGEAAFGTLIGPGFLDHFADAIADDLPTNIQAMRAFVRGVRRASRCRDDDLETALCGTWSSRPRSAPTSPPARSTATTCWARSTCRCSSPRAEGTRSCSRRWPSTSSPPARHPKSPGTKVAVTCPSSKSPNGSIANWPRSPAAPTPEHRQAAFDLTAASVDASIAGSRLRPSHTRVIGDAEHAAGTTATPPSPPAPNSVTYLWSVEPSSVVPPPSPPHTISDRDASNAADDERAMRPASRHRAARSPGNIGEPMGFHHIALSVRTATPAPTGAQPSSLSQRSSRARPATTCCWSESRESRGETVTFHPYMTDQLVAHRQRQYFDEAARDRLARGGTSWHLYPLYRDAAAAHTAAHHINRTTSFDGTDAGSGARPDVTSLRVG